MLSFLNRIRNMFFYFIISRKVSLVRASTHWISYEDSLSRIREDWGHSEWKSRWALQRYVWAPAGAGGKHLHIHFLQGLVQVRLRGSLWTSSSFSFYFSGPPLAQAIWRWPTFYYIFAASLARAGQLDIWVFDCLFISSGTWVYNVSSRTLDAFQRKVFFPYYCYYTMFPLCISM